MRLFLISTASAAALLVGSVGAQETNTQQPSTPTPPAAQEAPMTAPGTPANEMASPATGAGPTAEVSTENMIGRDVYGDNDQDLGEVADVILDPQTKQISKLVIETGGFLGLGEKTVAIDIGQVEIRPDQGIYVSGLTQEAVRDMAEYDPDDATVSLDKAPPVPTTTPAPTGGIGAPSAVPPAVTDTEPSR
jgi:sporulation protein YlmC with PRC-barrel domain